MASCPECEATIQAQQNIEVGEILPCQDCGVELEVRSLEPLTLGMAPKVEEDWGE